MEREREECENEARDVIESDMMKVGVGEDDAEDRVK